MAPPWVTALVTITVVAMWIASMAIGVLMANWEPLTITTPAMMLLAGFAFGIRIIRRQEPKNGD